MPDREDPRFHLMREQIELARAKAKTYAGPCSKCRYCQPGFLDNWCTHPIVVDAVAFNVADAYGRERIQTCEEQRDESSPWGPVVCGPQGLLFERRLSLWQRLFGARYNDE